MDVVVSGGQAGANWNWSPRTTMNKNWNLGTVSITKLRATVTQMVSTVKIPQMLSRHSMTKSKIGKALILCRLAGVVVLMNGYFDGGQWFFYARVSFWQ